MLTLDKIYHAAFVLKDVARKTDLIEAPKLSKDCHLYLKTENLQATGSFKVSDIVRSSGLPPIVYLPGVFCGFLFILTIKLRKHPFDLSTSHHAHQEMVKGLTTEFNGVTLLIVEVSHWYENVFLMGIIALFFINGKPWSYALAAVAVVLSYFLEILIDNTNARLKWQRMFKTTWAVTMIIGVINIFVLQVLKGV
jgi:ech hydrogenase subunit B